ncbi:ABC transporter substrate-binding protein [Propionivibrio soli]|uniref:ABC transporter substrate-binding protein n=1 Tax=Propionivibrio soli TaxID=2976531 RepID=UPI0021E7C577|nr:sugar ABC transporter substrate-binding protein [Propionivibrio soli]
MKKICRHGIAIAFGLLGLMGSPAWAQTPVNFWYHFDNPESTKLMDDLVSAFESKNPGIKVKAENVPWNNYYDKLFTSIVGGKAPDVAMVKLAQQPQLLEMGALEPIDKMVASWPGKDDLGNNLLEINKGPDGKQYYLPLQYVVVYLYYRADLFAKAGLEPPATCEAFLDAAKKLTLPASANNGVEQFGFGMRGGKGGYDNWGPFVLSQSDFTPGGMTSAKAISANTWYVDLFRKHKVSPPSAPNDGFNEIISTFKSGRTAMIFHHIGSSKTMVAAFGDKVSAVPAPSCNGGRWTSFGDESTALFKSSKNKEAAWKWMAFLSEGENNVKFNQATGQMTVTRSGAEKAAFEPRFIKATVDSLPFAKTLPAVPQSADFVNTVWPVNMQRALTGEITPEQMMTAFDKHYSTK